MSDEELKRAGLAALILLVSEGRWSQEEALAIADAHIRNPHACENIACRGARDLAWKISGM